MYTYEQRMTAVELLINSGFSENTVCLGLGCPPPQSLRNWYREYQETSTLHKNSAPKPKYTQQRKEAAVTYYVDNHATLTQTCRAMWYPTRYILREWISEIQPEALQSQNETCTHTGKRVKWAWEQRRAVVVDMVINKTPMYKVAAECGVIKTC